jgi:hypothetical protein
MDFSLNWLPNDDSITIDYNNILGLDIGSLGLFPSMMSSVAPFGPLMTQEASMLSGLVTSDILNQQQPHFHTESRNGTPWHVASPGAMSDPASGMVSRLNSTKSEGLYATSSNGARMPCTIRGRGSSRLIASATPLIPLAQLMDGKHDSGETYGFPDTSQVILDHNSLPSDSHASAIPTLSTKTYEALQRQFGKLCLQEQNIFPTFNTTNFPSRASLNLFVLLYFDNFDPILPIVHDRVVPLDDHWLLALAICAVGSQYAEADEFANCVEPLHQMLRRAITIEIDAWSLESAGESAHEIAVAQALTLNQIGMSYFGSPKLLKVARGQHGALVDLMRSSSFLKASPITSTTNRGGLDISPEATWRRTMLAECKRRIGYTIWVSLFYKTSIRFAD